MTLRYPSMHETGALLLLCVFALQACGGYASRSDAFRRSLTLGQPTKALDAVNEALGVNSAESMPEETDPDTPLLLLERASILQALGDYELSALNFQTADKSLDVLDLTSDTSGQIAKYLFSDDAVVYKSPPYEKLLINPCNMINYLVSGDISGAKVEARRFVINRKFIESQGDERGRSMLAFGSYLAGVAFERAGDASAAMRHYADAYTAGSLPTLANAIRSLNRRTGARDPRVNTLLPSPEAAETIDNDESEGVILVVVQAGMAPFKVAKRLPIGAAVVAASAPGPGARLSPAQRNRANRFAAKGLLKFINYPKLQKAPYAPPYVSVDVDGQQIPGGVAMDVESHALAAFEEIQGSLIAASLTRMLTRAVAGELGEALGRKGSGNSVAGLLIGMLVEGSMAAADTPDTRSWVTLPARFYVARVRMPAGRHRVSVRYRGLSRTRFVTVEPGNMHILNYSDIR
ncbi:MAG: hypothetical protein VX589_10100 [Myxococcota bacterium]|nr:hypothetical protein [Myxococcota bacterium]